MTAGTISEAETAETIKLAHDRWGKVICPHTAVAAAAALKRGKGQPQIALATAHPAKFPEFVTQALGFAPQVLSHHQLYGQKKRSANWPMTTPRP